MAALSTTMSPTCSAYSQGTVDPVVLQTGGSPLSTSLLSLDLSQNQPAALLQFQSGFATDERFAPGRFFDSFTATLTDDSGGNVLILFTADASGVSWAPDTEGGIPMAPASIVRMPVAFENLLTAPSSRTAYEISAPIPAALASRHLHLYFDLFDNQDSVNSLGYYNHVVVVPEPSVWFLLGLGGLGLALRRRFL